MKRKILKELDGKLTGNTQDDINEIIKATFSVVASKMQDIANNATDEWDTINQFEDLLGVLNKEVFNKTAKKNKP